MPTLLSSTVAGATGAPAARSLSSSDLNPNTARSTVLRWVAAATYRRRRHRTFAYRTSPVACEATFVCVPVRIDADHEQPPLRPAASRSLAWSRQPWARPGSLACAAASDLPSAVLTSVAYRSHPAWSKFPLPGVAWPEIFLRCDPRGTEA